MSTVVGEEALAGTRPVRRFARIKRLGMVGVSFAAGNATTSRTGAESGGVFQSKGGAGYRAPQPPLHGRRAKPRVQRFKPSENSGAVAIGASGTWHERPAWAHQLVLHPNDAARVERRGQRPPQGPDDRPMFTLQTQVNLRKPAEPRPYRQKNAQPTALPLSDTIVLANLDQRKVRVAPPKCVQNAIAAWETVWNTPRVHERQVIARARALDTVLRLKLRIRPPSLLLVVYTCAAAKISSQDSYRCRAANENSCVAQRDGRVRCKNPGSAEAVSTSFPLSRASVLLVGLVWLASVMHVSCCQV
eukprot:COSAG02_NODE_5196_length_4549_cov_2.138427_2_plen_303_part_00